MHRIALSGWLGLCVVASLATAAEEPAPELFFPKADAVVSLDGKSTVSAFEIIPPCFPRQAQGTKLEVYTVRGWGWVDRKQLLNKAEAEKYCEANKKDAYALYLRSFLQMMNDETEKGSELALADLNAALKIDPKFAPALSSRGAIYNERKKYAEASADFAAAVKAAPKDLLVANDLAWFRSTCPEARFRDGKVAVTEATRVCESTNYENESFLHTLAAACAEAGDFKSAVKWVSKAAEIDPEDEEFAAHLKLFKDKKPLRDDGK
jgi:tetratricopeptide (TPR) repeat protein